MEDQRNENFRDVCPLCGARRIDSQIGLERTPAEYIARLVDVFREVRRVLKSDGTLFVNIGDSYCAGPTGNVGNKRTIQGGLDNENSGASRPSKLIPGLKPKDLIGIPWMLAFALRDDGWWLRQDIIWAKPNPMPESVRDRCTKAHEYVFLLTKSARYYFGQDEVREPHAEVSIARANRNRFGGKYVGSDPAEHGALKRGAGYGPNGNHDSIVSPGGRNIRSVWNLATQPTPEAHFATFPLELPELCLKAGCPEGGIVLDPFVGAGTTILAALKNGRRAIGIELNPSYIEIAHSRIRKYYSLFSGDQQAEIIHSLADDPTDAARASDPEGYSAHRSGSLGQYDEQVSLWGGDHE